MTARLPAITVVIPVFNGSPYVGHAIRSVLDQTYRDFELVVVDDGSTDETDLVLDQIKDRRIRRLRHATNRGSAAARNTGVRAARGKYVAFLDADDAWLPSKLADQLECLCRSPENTRLVCTGFTIWRPDGTATVRQPASGGNSYDKLLWGCYLSPGSTALLERSCFDDIGDFDEDLRRLEDWDWLLRYAERYEIGFTPLVLAVVRQLHAPYGDSVRDGVKRIGTKHMSRAARRGWRSKRILRAALTLELAAQSAREGHRREAAVRVLRSLLHYPLRNLAFYTRMAGHAFRRERPAAVAGRAPGATLHLITDLETGGAERMLTEILTGRGAQSPGAMVVAMIPGGQFERRLADAGIRTISLGMKRNRPSLTALIKTVRLLRRERPAILQTWMYHADLFGLCALLLSGLRHRTRIYWGVRCSDMEGKRYGLMFRAVRRLCVLASPLVDVVIANSHAGLEFHRLLGYRPKNFVVIENGIDVPAFQVDRETGREVRAELGIPDGATVVAVVARVDPMKDYETLLDALRKLAGVHVLAIGKGTTGLPDLSGLHRLGERRDVPRLLAASDIIVSSSAFGEGSSNALLEGMAAGLPAVATDVGDARRIVGRAGGVVPPRDPEALARAISGLAEDEGLRRELGDRARARVIERFSLQRTIQLMDALHGSRGPGDPCSS